MAKVKREFVFATFLLSGIAVILSFVALGTQYWVTSDVKINEITSRNSYVHYGLFGGIYERIVGSAAVPNFELSMTCLMGENACAMLCDATSEARTATLEQLHAGSPSTFNCASLRRDFVYSGPRRTAARNDSSERSFINAGLWITTIIFLVISCLFGVFSTVLAMWNTVYNPVEVYFNISGLFVCNCVACAFSVLTLVMWGSQFAATLVKDVCVFDTIQGEATSDGFALLGFSYWLNLVSFLLYVASLVILGVRQHLINNQPPVKIDLDEDNDPGLILY